MAARKKASKKKTAKKKATRKHVATTVGKNGVMTTRKLADYGTLPAEVREELRNEWEGGNTDHVVDVIDPVEPTSINQIIIGLWLSYKEVAKRQSVQAKLSHLVKTGKIRRCGRGSYVLTGK